MAFALVGLLLASSPALAQSSSDRFEIGVQLAAAGRAELDEADLGFGARLGFRTGPLFSLEGEFNFFPADLPDDVPVTSSRLEALFGVKAGPRFGRLSFFGKARPGVVRFGEGPEPVACILIFPPPLSCVLAEGRTVFALDLGGGIDFELTERSLLRFDVSDSMLHYPGPVMTRDRRAIGEDGFWSHELRFSIGAALRF